VTHFTPTARDHLNNPVTAPSRELIERYEQAIAEFQCYRGDPVTTIAEALDQDSGFPMGHVLHGYLNLLGTEPAGFAVARANHEAASALPANARERAHVRALGYLIESEWRAAGRVLEDIAIQYPRDVLALQVGQLTDFFTGEARMLRDRIARALPDWDEGMPGYHAVLGMHAFGLEETGAYERAEVAGRRAVELEPGDAWAWHAVAHCMEMQGRPEDGIAWFRSDVDAWSRDNFFAVHNWWHLALFHLECGEIAAVLDLFDARIYGARSPLILDLLDASALLWRLHLRNVPLGDRWQAVADGWEPHAAAGNYAFNDMHAMMAFVCAGRPAAVQAVLEAQERKAPGCGDNADFTREVGTSVTRGILAFGSGDYAETVRCLRPVRNLSHRFGGSHAQRDLLDLTLLEAAVRDGQRALARALVAERLDRKPHTPANRALLERMDARPLAA